MAFEEEILVVNSACAAIGADPIDSLDDDTPGAQIAKLRYHALLRFIVGLPWAWSFCLRTVQLSKIDDPAILSGWKFAFDLPKQIAGQAVVGAPVAVADQKEFPDQKFTAYWLGDGHLTSDSEIIYARFKVLPKPLMMSGAFRYGFELALAAELAMGLASDKDLRDRLRNDAFGPPSAAGMGGAIGIAVQADKSSQQTAGPLRGASDPLTNAWIG